MIVPQLQSVFVFVRDLDRAIFFYCGTLGFPLRRRWAGGAEVGDGGAALTLAIADVDTAPEATGRSTGIPFAVDRATYDTLAQRGVFADIEICVSANAPQPLAGAAVRFRKHDAGDGGIRGVSKGGQFIEFGGKLRNFNVQIHVR